MTNQNPEVVLIVSVGERDIKLWCNTDNRGIGNFEPKSPNTKQQRGKTRPFHDYLLSKTSRYKFYNTANQVPAQHLSSDTQLKNLFNESLDFINFLNSNQHYPLVAAKLSTVIEEILAEQNRQKFTVKRVLVFATDRRNVEDCHFNLNEPVAAGPLIAQWRAERFNRP